VTSHMGSFLLRHLCLEIGRRGGARDTVLMTFVSSVHNPKIMLGMLVKVLRGDSIATRKRLPREGVDRPRHEPGHGPCVHAGGRGNERAGAARSLAAGEAARVRTPPRLRSHWGAACRLCLRRNPCLNGLSPGGWIDQPRTGGAALCLCAWDWLSRCDLGRWGPPHRAVAARARFPADTSARNNVARDLEGNRHRGFGDHRWRRDCLSLFEIAIGLCSVSLGP
jgi:hypothetical protein